MRFEWDGAKNEANIAKHGISFPQAARIFEGVVVSRTDDRQDYGEERTISYGVIDEAVIATVVHTDQRHDSHHLGAARIDEGKEGLP